MVILVRGHKYFTFSAHVILTVTGWDVIVFLNRWRAGRVEHATSIEKLKETKIVAGEKDAIGTKNKSDDVPGAAQEHKGGDFLYTTRDPYWFTKEHLTKSDLNKSSTRIKAVSRLLDGLAPIKADRSSVTERTLLAYNFLELKLEEERYDEEDDEDDEDNEDDGKDEEDEREKEEMKDSEDIKINQTANADRIEVSPSKDPST